MNDYSEPHLSRAKALISTPKPPGSASSDFFVLVVAYNIVKLLTG